jgi:citrate synthase
MAEVHHGLEGVVAFETEIAEPDKEGSALRYRGVDIEDIVGRVPFENIWGLLIDGSYTPGLPPAEPYTLAVHTVTSASTCRRPWRCWRRPSASVRPTTSATSRHATTSPALP